MNTAAPSRKRSLYRAEVIVNRPVCREHLLLTVRIPAEQAFPGTKPGQFIQLGCNPTGPAEAEDQVIEWQPGEAPKLGQIESTQRLAFLRRPFSLAGRRDTDAGAELDVIYRTVGKGTEWLAMLSEGASLDLIGPLGNAFSLPAGKSIGLLVGGGVGLPPMFYVAEAMRSAGWDGCGFVGATTSDLLAVTFGACPSKEGEPTPCVQQFADHALPAVVTTDDGSCGMAGRITDGLQQYVDAQDGDDRSKTVIFTCGPEPMMKAVAAIAEQHGIECQVCVEQAMACGMGTCQSCVVKMRDALNPHGRLPDGTRWRYRLACTDGPVFDARDVVW